MGSSRRAAQTRPRFLLVDVADDVADVLVFLVLLLEEGVVFVLARLPPPRRRVLT